MLRRVNETIEGEMRPLKSGDSATIARARHDTVGARTVAATGAAAWPFVAPAAAAAAAAGSAAAAAAAFWPAAFFSVFCFLRLFQPSMCFFSTVDSSLAYCSSCTCAGPGCRGSSSAQPLPWGRVVGPVIRSEAYRLQKRLCKLCGSVQVAPAGPSAHRRCRSGRACQWLDQGFRTDTSRAAVNKLRQRRDAARGARWACQRKGSPAGTAVRLSPTRRPRTPPTPGRAACSS